ncbi:hypothetical protein [Haloarchaeobius sp. HRN-SO-5]|uniref:hypothetical protein n=1 Tax=Haloarchaeobius sp. HRN-SO-5 TaxID=3446118 RepID=UPI003EBD5059
MQHEKLALVAIVLAVLLPMWFVAIQGEPPSEEIRIDQSVSEIRPLDGFVDTPNKLSPSQVGVVVWVALLALVGVLSFFHRFMNYAARPDGDADSTAADGGATAPGLSWFETEDRWVVEYAPASDALAGLVAMGGLTVLAIVFAALFTGEYLTLARTQYFGVYAFGMFMSLTGLTVSYYAWFMPHVEVAERRGHR